MYSRRAAHSTLRLALAGGIVLSALTPFAARAQNTQLVTGKKITLPPVGPVQNVGSLPMNMIATPDGQYVITTDMGFRQALVVLRASDGTIAGRLEFPNPAPTQTNGLYYGLAIKANGDGTSTLYAAQGGNASIAILSVGANGALTQTGTIAMKTGDFPAGLALDSRGYLYVAVNEFSASGVDLRIVTSPGSLAVINTATGVETSRYSFNAQLSNFPLAVAALADGSKIYVSSQRDGAVYALNAANPAATPVLAGVLPTGAHPDALLLNRAQSRLFIANAHSDTVTIVNTANNAVLGTILLRPTGATTIAGATPTNLALSPDETTLYVTLGDMNAVAVVALNNLTNSVVTGYIPTGWYPTGVYATAGKKLLVSNAKGTQTRYPNNAPYGPNGSFGTYDLNVIEGNVEFIGVPNKATLALQTQQVAANNVITPTTATPPNPLAGIGLAAGKIKHVVYIIKENRTYDQVLGDLTDAQGNPLGNGDPSLTLFGQAVTPNLHALAQRFVLLDNFYDCGEASGDGWPWSTQGIATEYVIKNLPYNYSGRGRQYDFEGQNNGYPVGGFPARDPNGKLNSALFPNGAPAIPDVSEAPAHHIWDNVLTNLSLAGTGLTSKFRNYGFFTTFGVASGTTPLLPDNYPTAVGLLPPGHDLAGNTDFDFRRFDTDYADSDAPQIYHDQLLAAGDTTGAARALYALPTYGTHNAPSRFSEFKTEFSQMLANDPTGSSVPAFMTVRFMKDHTAGVSAGIHTPRAEVSDNDYGVGQFVDLLSHSAIWNNTAIFVIEDDAQDGQDHVDAHRSTCYVLSPYIKANSVDHTFYNTDSVLKTMELLLGLPPMSQYDAIANPILDFDNTNSNSAVYNAILPAPAVINEIAAVAPKNSAMARLAKLTATMDFKHPDSADPRLLNEVIWKSVKGIGSNPPAPRHSLALAAPAKPGKVAPVGKAASAAHTQSKAKTARHDDDDD